MYLDVFFTSFCGILLTEGTFPPLTWFYAGNSLFLDRDRSLLKEGITAMPFVKKNNSQAFQSPSNAHPIFIGRTHELHFFVQNILKPDEPTHNILSIWG